jgi:hypothetical protein
MKCYKSGINRGAEFDTTDPEEHIGVQKEGNTSKFHVLKGAGRIVQYRCSLEGWRLVL